MEGGRREALHFPEPLPVASVRGLPSKTCLFATPSLQDALFASQEKFFQELFDSELASQATAEFEKAMKELAEEEPHLVEQFQKLSEAAGRVGEEAPQGWNTGNKLLWSLLPENGRTLRKADRAITTLGWGQEVGRGMATGLQERNEAGKSLKRLLKTDHLKGHGVVVVILENRPTQAQFLQTGENGCAGEHRGLRDLECW